MPESNLCVALFVRPSKERHQQGFGLFAQTFFSRALQSKAHFPSFKPHLKGSARLQGFTLRGQYFFSRALQGFSKASLSKILVKGYAREGFNKRSSSSFNQSDTVPETNRYAPPTS